MMVRIGARAPRFRTPGIVDGELMYVDSQRLLGRWVVLCFVPHVGASEARYLERQALLEPFSTGGALLLGVGARQEQLEQPWLTQISPAGLLADPLGRLRRIYHVTGETPQRCRSFVLDPEGMLQFDVRHDLCGLSIQTFAEMVKAAQGQSGRTVCEPVS